MTSDNSESNKQNSIIEKFRINFLAKFKIKSTAKTNNHFSDTSTFLNLEHSKQEMIRGIIKLSSTKAREIMIPRVDMIALDSNTPLKSLIKVVYNTGHSRIPVYENTIEKIIGILYVKDLLKFIIDKPRNFQLSKILHKPFFVPETMALDDLLLEFKQRILHLAIVVDEYGGVSGIITLQDILEEIIGDIKAEYDNEVPEVIKIDTSTFKVDSRMLLADFNKEVKLDLPTDEFDTIGGFVVDLFGEIPKKHETIKHHDILFKIEGINGTRINQIIVTIPTP